MCHSVLDLVVYHHNIDNKQVKVNYLYQYIQHLDTVYLHQNILEFSLYVLNFIYLFFRVLLGNVSLHMSPAKPTGHLHL
jgi:hypothetical protein